MSRDKIYNFSAGPSVLPESALESARRDLLDYQGCGISVMEMSHRSPMFQEIFDTTKARLKSVLRVPDSHEVLLLQGGATLQFAAIPMNLMEGAAADYAVTGPPRRRKSTAPSISPAAVRTAALTASPPKSSCG